MANIKHKNPGVRPAPQPGTFVIDYRDHLSRRQQKAFHGSESDAAKFRRAILVKVDRIKAGLEISPGEKTVILTLSELWTAFETDRQLKINAGSMDKLTLDRCLNSFKNLLIYDASLKHKGIDNITSKDFEGFKAYRREKGFAPEGINIDVRKLKTIFNFAVGEGFLDKSPLAKVSFVNVPPVEVRFLNEDELKRLLFVLDCIDPANEFQRDARDLTLFYLYTGARASEALYPTFDWTCNKPDKVRFPKTKNGKDRTIPKTETVKAILEGRKHISDGPFHFDRHQVYKRVGWALDQAGIADASVHTLRKTAGAWYYMSTKDIFATSKFLGHSTVVVTEQHYAGLIQSLQIKYAMQFEKALTANLPITCFSEGNQGQSKVMQEVARPSVATG